MDEYSFQVGFSQVQKRDLKEVRHRIMSVLNLTTRASWYARLNGRVEPRISEVRQIEEIFEEYGIKEVWGRIHE